MGSSFSNNRTIDQQGESSGGSPEFASTLEGPPASLILDKLKGFKVQERLSGSSILLVNKEGVEAVLSIDAAHSAEVRNLFEIADNVRAEGAPAAWTIVESLLHRTASAPAEATVENDRYTELRALNAADVKLSLVLPADSKDVFKARRPKLLRVAETPELYADVTKKRLVTPKAEKRDAWVRNIVEGISEADRVFRKTDKYLVVKDSKWTTDSTSDLHYLVLLQDEQVRSLRDLRGEEHLPLLREIRDSILPALAEEHGMPARNLVAYAHYHPTFYYFHVHIMTVDNPQFQNNKGSDNLIISVFDRFHALNTVIDLLEGRSDYYAHCTMPLLLAPAIAAWYGVVEEEEGDGRGKVGSAVAVPPPANIDVGVTPPPQMIEEKQKS